MMVDRCNGAKSPLKIDLQICTGKGISNALEHSTITWEAFISRLSKASIDSSITTAQYQGLPTDDKLKRKSSRGYYLPAIVEGSTRNSRAVLARTLATIDIEGNNADIGQINRILSKYEYHWHETRSSTPESKRYRIIIPLQEAMPPEVYRKTVNALCDELEFYGVQVDRKTSNTPSQVSFFPTTNSDQKFNNGLHIGAPLPPIEPIKDTTLTQGVDLKAKSPATTQQIADALSYLKQESDDRRTWIDYGMALYHQYDGSIEGLELWDQWSQYSGKYPGFEEIDKKWSGFHIAGANTITAASILRAAKLKGYQHTKVEPVEPVDELLSQASVANLLQTDPPPLQWLVPDLLPAQKVGLLIAPGGTGKSFLALQMAFSVASGAPFLGRWEIDTPGSVLYLAAEDDRDDVHRRLRSITDSMIPFFDGDQNTLDGYLQNASRHLHVLSRVGKPNLLTVADGKEVSRTNRVEQLIEAANRLTDLKLIIIDPVKRFAGGDENSQEDMTRFVETLEHVRQQTGTNVLALHHANKASQRTDTGLDQGASRGASALTDAVRWQANMIKMDEQAAALYNIPPERVGHYVAFGVSKTNYTAPLGRVWLERQTGGALQHVELREDAPVGRSNTHHLEALDNIVQVVRQRQQMGQLVSPRNLLTDYSGIDGPIGVSARQLQPLIDELIAAGRVQISPSNGPGGGSVLTTGEEIDS